MAIPLVEYIKYTAWAPIQLERFQEYITRGAPPPNAFVHGSTTSAARREDMCGALAHGAVQPFECRRCLARRAPLLRDSHVGTAGGTALWRGEWCRVAEETVLWPYPRHRPTPMGGHK